MHSKVGHERSTKFRIIEKVNHQRNIQPAFTCSKLTIETLEQSMKYVQS